MIELNSNMPDNVLAATAIGRVSAQDYREVLIPAAEEKIKKYGRIRLLYFLGPRFRRFGWKALVDDALFGFRMLKHFDRIAVVTDSKVWRTVTRNLAPWIECPVRLFENEDVHKAEDWIAEPA